MNVKLTDKDGRTHGSCQWGGGCQWGEGVSHKAKRGKMEPCSETAIHFYTDPLLAVFYNPMHGNYNPETYLMWEVEPHGKTRTDGLKSWCKSLTTLKQIVSPVITTKQRVEIVIRISLEIYKDSSYTDWANNWLSGKDRSSEAADAASRAASETARITFGAARITSEAAWIASEAARMASEAAWAAEAARMASETARTASQAAKVDPKLDLLAIIKQVVQP